MPGDMTYEEWEKAFRDGGEKKGLAELFQPMSAYKKADGSFDLEAAKEDYKKFLQTVPEPYKIYLEQSMDAVQYVGTDKPDIVCGFHFSDDTFLYNAKHEAFYRYDFRMAMTHELGHRIDRFFVRSWEHADFRDAIQKAAAVLDENPRFFIEHCEDNDTDGFLSDILSGICGGKYELLFGHKEDYWKKPYSQEREIFTNLFSLCSYQDEKKLNFLREHFPEIVHCFEFLMQAL